MKKIILIAILFVTFTACTDNQKAKNFGGTTTIELPQGLKLINITWKEDEIWYLTKQMDKNDIAEMYFFKEESSFDVWEGTVIIKEKK